MRRYSMIFIIFATWPQGENELNGNVFEEVTDLGVIKAEWRESVAYLYPGGIRGIGR